MATGFETAVSLITKLIDTAKSILTVIFIHNSARIKVDYELLKKQSERHAKQLDIAARPRRSWDDLLERMRQNEL